MSKTNIVDTLFKEVRDFEVGITMLTDRVPYSQYETVQTIQTHQNNGFLTELEEGQTDDRDFIPNITPMIQTTTVNVDIDSESFDIFTVGERHQAQGFIGKSLLFNFLKQTNHGEKINSIIEKYSDDGNVVARKVNKDGEIYKLVQLQNLYVIDQTAETLEDTDVIEKSIMNQSQLRALKSLGFKNIDKVINDCNLAKGKELPYYELFYRYGDVLESELETVMKDLNEEEYDSVEESETVDNSIQTKDIKSDLQNNSYIPALVVVARAKKGKKEYSQVDGINNSSSKGIIVFAEKLVPEIIKISDKLIIKKYKPYEEAHFGDYNGRWLRVGMRETAIPFQNRFNELHNQLREIFDSAKIVFWTTDEGIAGKNIITSIENCQILQAKDLAVLNNQFPDLSAFSVEWNKLVNEAQKALKAFEVATGESTPSTASATAIAVQNQAVGKYFNYKREKIGLFFTSVFKRWVIPELLKNTTTEEVIEIIGDPNYMEEYTHAVAQGWFINEVLFNSAIQGKVISKQQAEQVIEMKKQELLKQSKLFTKLENDFFKGVELYVGINPTGEIWNKQNRITNGLQLLQYISNPLLMQNPETRDVVVQIANELGIKISPSATTGSPTLQPLGQQNNNNLPQREQSASEQELSNQKV
ncbi:MAG: hypothetical protein HY959_03760 [Ignavibacteriae bacterium]|nr:hypothetical protein [Ignavibacteriota bacterium]